jgi:hypothetical protein
MAVEAPWGFWCNTNDDVPGVDFNDMTIDDSGNLRVVTGADYILQTIKNNIWLWLGEYDFNIQAGVAWRTLLGNPNVSQALFRYYIQTAVFAVNDTLTPDQLKIWGVKEIVSYTYSYSNNSRIVNLNLVVTLNGSNTKLIINI